MRNLPCAAGHSSEAMSWECSVPKEGGTTITSSSAASLYFEGLSCGTGGGGHHGFIPPDSQGCAMVGSSSTGDSTTASSNLVDFRSMNISDDPQSIFQHQQQQSSLNLNGVSNHAQLFSNFMNSREDEPPRSSSDCFDCTRSGLMISHHSDSSSSSSSSAVLPYLSFPPSETCTAELLPSVTVTTVSATTMRCSSGTKSNSGIPSSVELQQQQQPLKRRIFGDLFRDDPNLSAALNLLPSMHHSGSALEQQSSCATVGSGTGFGPSSCGALAQSSLFTSQCNIQDSDDLRLLGPIGDFSELDHPQQPLGNPPEHATRESLNFDVSAFFRSPDSKRRFSIYQSQQPQYLPSFPPLPPIEPSDLGPNNQFDDCNTRQFCLRREPENNLVADNLPDFLLCHQEADALAAANEILSFAESHQRCNSANRLLSKDNGAGALQDFLLECPSSQGGNDLDCASSVGDSKSEEEVLEEMYLSHVAAAAAAAAVGMSPYEYVGNSTRPFGSFFGSLGEPSRSSCTISSACDPPVSSTLSFCESGTTAPCSTSLSISSSEQLHPASSSCREVPSAAAEPLIVDTDQLPQPNPSSFSLEASISHQHHERERQTASIPKKRKIPEEVQEWIAKESPPRIPTSSEQTLVVSPENKTLFPSTQSMSMLKVAKPASAGRKEPLDLPKKRHRTEAFILSLHDGRSPSASTVSSAAARGGKTILETEDDNENQILPSVDEGDQLPLASDKLSNPSTSIAFIPEQYQVEAKPTISLLVESKPPPTVAGAGNYRSPSSHNYSEFCASEVEGYVEDPNSSDHDDSFEMSELSQDDYGSINNGSYSHPLPSSPPSSVVRPDESRQLEAEEGRSCWILENVGEAKNSFLMRPEEEDEEEESAEDLSARCGERQIEESILQDNRQLQFPTPSVFHQPVVEARDVNPSKSEVVADPYLVNGERIRASRYHGNLERNSSYVEPPLPLLASSQECQSDSNASRCEPRGDFENGNHRSPDIFGERPETCENYQGEREHILSDFGEGCEERRSFDDPSELRGIFPDHPSSYEECESGSVCCEFENDYDSRRNNSEDENASAMVFREDFTTRGSFENSCSVPNSFGTPPGGSCGFGTPGEPSGFGTAGASGGFGPTESFGSHGGTCPSVFGTPANFAVPSSNCSSFGAAAPEGSDDVCSESPFERRKRDPGGFYGTKCEGFDKYIVESKPRDKYASESSARDTYALESQTRTKYGLDSEQIREDKYGKSCESRGRDRDQYDVKVEVCHGKKFEDTFVLPHHECRSQYSEECEVRDGDGYGSAGSELPVDYATCERKPLEEYDDVTSGSRDNEYTNESQSQRNFPNDIEEPSGRPLSSDSVPFESTFQKLSPNVCVLEERDEPASTTKSAVSSLLSLPPKEDTGSEEEDPQSRRARRSLPHKKRIATKLKLLTAVNRSGSKLSAKLGGRNVFSPPAGGSRVFLMARQSLPKKRALPCSKCSEIFFSQQQYLTHRQTVHHESPCASPSLVPPSLAISARSPAPRLTPSPNNRTIRHIPRSPSLSPSQPQRISVQDSPGSVSVSVSSSSGRAEIASSSAVNLVVPSAASLGLPVVVGSKSAAVSRPSYTCNECGHSCNDQFAYFTHMKIHYEPSSVVVVTTVAQHSSNSSLSPAILQRDSASLSKPPRKRLYPKLVPKTTPPPPPFPPSSQPPIILEATSDNILSLKMDSSMRITETASTGSGAKSSQKSVDIRKPSPHKPMNRAPVSDVKSSPPSVPVRPNGLPIAIHTFYSCPLCPLLLLSSVDYEKHLSNAHFVAPHAISQVIEETRNRSGPKKGSPTILFLKKMPPTSDPHLKERNSLIVPASNNSESLVTLAPVGVQNLKSSPREELPKSVEDSSSPVSPPQDLKCPKCSRSFQYSAALNKHMLKHGGSNTDQSILPSNQQRKMKYCELCKKEFTRAAFFFHNQGHTADRKWACCECGKSFLTSSALITHKRLHTGAKPYACSVCQKNFRQKGDLIYHFTSLHTDMKPFSCDVCGKKFSRKYSLSLHQKVHSGEKKHKCDLCGKQFRAASYLQSHRRTHTGEKPYPCTLCAKSFAVKADLNRHFQIHDKDRPPPSERRRQAKQLKPPPPPAPPPPLSGERPP